jgi:twitching motility protein PilT
MNLEGIVTQSLLPKADGRGRVLGVEVLIPNAAIRHLIRDNKIHQIYSSMQTGQEKYGMITFNQSLASLYFKRDITLELAMAISHNPEELNEIVKRGPSALASQFRPGYAGAGATKTPAQAEKFRNF